MTRHRIFILSAIGFISGVGVGEYLPFRPAVLIVGIVSSAFLLGWSLRQEEPTLHTLVTTTTLTSLLFGMLYLNLYLLYQKPVLPFGQQVEFQGYIIKEPEKTTKGQKFTVRTEQFQKPTNILILISKIAYTNRESEYTQSLQYGDRLTISGQMEKPKKFDNFDYPGYLKKDGVYGIIVQPDVLIRHVQSSSETNHGNLIVSQLYRLRHRLEDSLKQAFPEPQAALTAGIILGSRQNIPNNLMDSFNRTGTSHIVAVSGYNVTIIVTALVRIGISQTIHRRFQILTGFVIFFVTLTGASASVVRGGLIAWLSVWARANSRIAWPLPLILSTMLLMILHNPLILIHDIGFQLSTTAFAGLLFLSPMIHSYVRANNYPPLLKNVVSLLIETFSASLPTIPLTMFYFHRFSTIFLIVNLFILWTIPLIMALGFIAGIGGLLNPTLGIILAQPCIILEKYLIWVVEMFGKFGWSSVEI